MIEIIAVLLILGILAFFAAGRLSGPSTYDLASQIEVIKGHLRYAQSRSLAGGSSAADYWGINFISATEFYLFKGLGSTSPVLLPGEDQATVNLSTKSSELRITSAPQRITFNEYGSPFLDAATTSSTITIVTNGGDIVVTRNTGFIP